MLKYLLILDLCLIFQALSGKQYFALGAVAKAVSTVVTYPLQVAQCKQRVGWCHFQIHEPACDLLLWWWKLIKIK